MAFLCVTWRIERRLFLFYYHFRMGEMLVYNHLMGRNKETWKVFGTWNRFIEQLASHYEVIMNTITENRSGARQLFSYKITLHCLLSSQQRHLSRVWSVSLLDATHPNFMEIKWSFTPSKCFVALFILLFSSVTQLLISSILQTLYWSNYGF